MGIDPVVLFLFQTVLKVCLASLSKNLLVQIITAKTAAHRLLGLRQTAWRRRMDSGWATRQPS